MFLKIIKVNIPHLIPLLLYLVFTNCIYSQNNYNVLVVTGGKQIERQSFLSIFDNMDNIDYEEAIQPGANNIYDSPEADNYDVILFYDFVQEITEDQKRAFIGLLAKGKGIIFLHHSLVSYQDWEEYEKIIGGRYYQSTNKIDSVKYFQSTYKHDVKIPVQIVDKEHPVTKGIEDFVIHDEIYGKYKILPNVTPILKTTHPESEKIIGWTNMFGKSKIVYIQLGHDHNAYENTNYRRLIKQSIEWVANN